MMKKNVFILVMLVMAFMLGACSGTNKDSNMKEMEKSQQNSTSSTEKTNPEAAVKDEKKSEDKKEDEKRGVSIENFNKTLHFDFVPEKVMSIDLTNTETLLALDLEAHIGAIRLGHFQLEEMLPENEAKARKLNFPEEIKEGVPTIESIIKLSPDLLVMNSYYFNAPIFGTYEDYEKNGIQIYVSEGSYGEDIGIESVYKDINQLSKIFGVEEKGEALIQSFKDRVEVVKKKVKNKELVRVLAVDSIGEELSVGGGKGLENELIEIAGGKNIFEDIDKQYAKVGLEDIIERNPQFIIVHSYGNDNDAKEKIAFLKSKKELSEIEAVKKNQILMVKLIGVFPGVQNFNVLEKMAEFFHSN